MNRVWCSDGHPIEMRDVNGHSYRHHADTGNRCYHDPQMAETDNINHPSHYTAYIGLEVIDLTEQMNFNRGNAVKYICRAGFKGDDKTEVEDLKKAAWYIQREIDRLEMGGSQVKHGV